MTSYIKLINKNDPNNSIALEVELENLEKLKTVLVIDKNSKVKIIPLDDEARKYSLENWTSGCVTGAQYALQKADLVFDKGIILKKLIIKVKSYDIPMISCASSIAVFNALGCDNQLDLENWEITDSKITQ
jgi:hypothetical protein